MEPLFCPQVVGVELGVMAIGGQTATVKVDVQLCVLLQPSVTEYV